MKRCYKVFSVVWVLILITGCVSPFMKYYPTEQPETIWSTEDGRAYFYVSEGKEPIIGYIQNDSEIINVEYSMRPQVTRIMVYYIDDDIENCIEEWDVKSVTRNKLIIYVDKSTYFKKGETLVFFRRKQEHR